MTGKRPFGVTLLLWVVLTLSAWGAVRSMGAIRWWNELSELEASLSPVYLSITGAGWALAGIVIFGGIRSRTPWSRYGSALFIATWLVEYWTVRLIFQATRSNAGFALITSIVLLAMTLYLARHQSTIHYYRKSEEHDHTIEHSTSE